MQNFLRQQGGMQPQKLLNTYKPSLKKTWNKTFLGHQMQTFLRQAGVQPPKSLCIRLHLDLNKVWN